jgi:hypothetical protein
MHCDELIRNKREADFCLISGNLMSCGTVARNLKSLVLDNLQISEKELELQN